MKDSFSTDVVRGNHEEGIYGNRYGNKILIMLPVWRISHPDEPDPSWIVGHK